VVYLPNVKGSMLIILLYLNVSLPYLFHYDAIYVVR